LARTITTVGGTTWFERTSLVAYVLYLASVKLLPVGVDCFLRRPYVARRVRHIDERAARFNFARRNQIRLIWGSVKS
jgi:hypothetical protein